MLLPNVDQHVLLVDYRRLLLKNYVIENEGHPEEEDCPFDMHQFDILAHTHFEHHRIVLAYSTGAQASEVRQCVLLNQTLEYLLSDQC